MEWTSVLSPSAGRRAVGAALVCVTALLALAAGCQQEVTRTPSAVPTVVVTKTGGKGGARASNSANGPDSPAARLATDPCATQLHDVCGPMLEYYALNGRLPGRVEELQQMADLGTELSFVCPQSHKPYVYEPQGLQIAGNPRRLVMYDAGPDHGGLRWGIVMTQAAGTRPLAFWVIPLTEQDVKAYQAGAP